MPSARITYAAPMKVTLRLIVFEVDAETEARSVLDIKEQDVYMGDMPLMTDNGTFVINGTERVIVSQMHRSPGVLFDHDRGKTHSSGKFLFAARVIPYRGSWLDFEFDAKDIVNVRIDRKRKLPVTALLHALGLNDEEILHFYNNHLEPCGWRLEDPFVPKPGAAPSRPSTSSMPSGEVVFAAGTKISPRAANKAEKDGLTDLLIPTEEIFGRYSANDLINESTGRIYIEAGDEVTPENLAALDAPAWTSRPARHRPCRHRSLDPQHAEGRQGRGPRPRPGRHLSRDAPRRTADARNRRSPVRRPVLRRRPLRPVGRGPRQAEHASGPRCEDTSPRCAPTTSCRRQGTGEPEGRQGRSRRHRQPRQPSRAFGGRAAGEPVPRRPAAHGTRRQGAHELGRRVDRDAQRPDQRQAGRGRRA
jgi:DNA-directed RNA polymerase beta subunit